MAGKAGQKTTEKQQEKGGPERPQRRRRATTDEGGLEAVPVDGVWVLCILRPRDPEVGRASLVSWGLQANLAISSTT